MSFQAIFDKSVIGILAQGCQSFNGVGNPNASTHGCQYRGPNQTKCAVGHLISDEQILKYRIMEGTSVGTFPVDLIKEINPDCKDDVDEIAETRIFLANLQSAHDNRISKSGPEFLENFISKVNQIADRYQLRRIKP